MQIVLSLVVLKSCCFCGTRPLARAVRHIFPPLILVNNRSSGENSEVFVSEMKIMRCWGMSLSMSLLFSLNVSVLTWCL